MQNKLLYGDASMNFNSLLQSMPAIHDLFLSNACVPSATTVGYSMTECTTTFMDGILARGGLRGATTEYFQLVEQALRDREALLAAGVCNTTILATDPSLRLMDKLGSVYLAPAYGVASSTVHRVGSDAISVFVTNDIALAFICIVAMFVVYLAMYRPRIYKMDRDIKDCRGLLLLFPDDVVRSIPAVAQAGRDMVAAVSGTEAH
ncbi:hypothetical protein EON62_00080 [archaeon]|nr:MAG: hypothetical protein EON62_00080 [archaeon]